MPTEMQRLEQDILDKLDEMRLASKGQLLPKAIHMEAAAVLQQPQGDKEPEGLEKRLLDKGVRPFSVQALREDEVVNNWSMPRSASPIRTKMRRSFRACSRMTSIPWNTVSSTPSIS